MSRGKIILTVVITIAAVAVLAAGGYMLYRWGYARGLGAEPGEALRSCFGGQFTDEPGELLVPEFGRGFMHWGQRGGYAMPHMNWFGFSPFGWVGGLFGLLLGGGVLALAVYGVISLLRRDRTSAADMEKKARK